MPARAGTVAPIAGTNYYTHGLATIGWEPELTVDLVENLHTPGAEKLRAGAEAFLDMWERAFPPESTQPASARLASTSGETSGGEAKVGAGHRCRSGECKMSGISTNLKCR